MGGFFLLAFAQTVTIEKEEIEMPEEHEKLVALRRAILPKVIISLG